MKLGRAVILSAGVAIVVGVGLFYGSRFTHRRVPTEKAGIVKIGLDPNRIIAVEKVEPSAEPEIGDDVKSPPKNDQVTFKLPKSVIEDMGLGARLVDVQDASIAGVLINSKGGSINWSCTGVTNFRSELPVVGKTGWQIIVNQAGTTKTPSVWHSKPQIDVTNIASGDVYEVVAECDIRFEEFGPRDVRPLGATVKWHAPVRIGSAPADAEHHSP